MNDASTVLWRADQEDIRRSRLYDYQMWLSHHFHIQTEGYESLWKWSADNPSHFWESIAQYFNIKFHSPYYSVVSEDPMPGTKWFEGGTINYAEHIFHAMKDTAEAIIFVNEQGDERIISNTEMWQEVSKMQQYLLHLGVGEGDRVCGFLPNIPEATYAFLATISLGAIWSCCSQDFGVSSVVDRFAQIEPKAFIAADGYYYGGKVHSKLHEIKEIKMSLPTLKETLIVSYTSQANKTDITGVSFYANLRQPEKDLEFVPVEFNHPIWILYSSGTTGAPKAITHSHGGCLLEHLKYLAFHNDVHQGEHFFWYTTTGWMMWNFLQGSMLLGATIVLYDGHPGYPDLFKLWALAERHSIHHFGTSAPYLVSCMKAGIDPCSKFHLKNIRSIGSTGSPLPPEAFDWVYQSVHNNIWLCSMSGGTDVCTAFVGGVIEKPVIRGEIQCRALGCSLHAFDEQRQPVIDSLGEMVITKPMPSMPVFFWNDPGMKKYRASYFEDIPGVWRHGDWVRISPEGGIVIYGRSDATLNRHGIRIGTAEIYRVLNEIPEIEDGLIVNLELAGGRHFMPLFIKLKNSAKLDENLINTINNSLKKQCSPRHVPDTIVQVADIPYTISGKKMEAPVKKILLGMDVEESLNKDAMRNPESLAFFMSYKVPD